MTTKPMKIALLQNDDFSMYHFHGDMIRRFIAAGHQVTAIIPDGKYVDRIRSLGVRVILIRITRFINPVSDALLFVRLFALFRREKFDILHTITIKPNIYGTIAASWAGAQTIVGMVSGAGFVFGVEPKTVRQRLFKRCLMVLFRYALARSARVWFVNQNDADDFVGLGLIRREKCVVIRGAGINSATYAPGTVPPQAVERLRTELGLGRKHCHLLVAARLIWSKGIAEFLEAARRLAEDYPDWAFVLIAPEDADTPDAMPIDEVRRRAGPNVVVVHDFRSDIQTFIAMSEVAVFPSFYREGLPTFLLEAMAMGKPVVTTINYGCKETVDEGRNGFLVPKKDVDALVTRLRSLMASSALREELGRHSRQKILTEFDEKIVTQAVLQKLYCIQ